MHLFFLGTSLGMTRLASVRMSRTRDDELLGRASSGTISPDRTQGSAGLVHPASCPKRSGDWQADTARHWLKIDSRGQEEQYAISIPYRKDLKVSVNMAVGLVHLP